MFFLYLKGICYTSSRIVQRLCSMHPLMIFSKTKIYLQKEFLLVLFTYVPKIICFKFF